MEKRNNRTLRDLYRKPLPIDLCVDEEGLFPALIVHNPISWIYVLCKLALIYSHKPPQAHVPLISVEARPCGELFVFQVHDEQDMAKLWAQGFFGKGTLSRSDPSWYQRVLRRLKLESGLEVTKEEVTRARREERKKYKELRSQIQTYEALERQNRLSAADQSMWDALKAQMEDTKNVKQDFVVRDDELEWRPEDLDLLDENNRLRKLESLQLQKVEVFFLAFALDSVKVVQAAEEVSEEKRGDESENVTTAATNLLGLSLSQIFSSCCTKLQPDDKFIIDYVVYHHFRSLAWCVRSGIKFGCDFLLYKRGPPFMHAEYGVMVIPNRAGYDSNTWKSWEDFMSVSRVVGGVRKTLVLVYVDIPLRQVFDQYYKHNMTKSDFIGLLQLYKVTEIISKRWLPSRTRD